jgi:hypothetical protein
MNNPDERTAVEQFGKGDKYFGICTLLATLPGLPMFGHGQIEGFTEKYGMEYRRAYWDEQPDGYLVERHMRDIFPLLKRRYLFAEAHNFRLYDFFTPDGSVNEDVFAYSNGTGEERAMVVYHNRYASARGWIRTSAAYLVKSEGGQDGASGERTVTQSTLGQGLGLSNDPTAYTIFRDHSSGLEFIRNNGDIHANGLYFELEAYKYHVFLDFRQVRDNGWRPYSQLNAYLNGRGVPSIEGALNELLLQSVSQPFRELVNPGFIQWLRSQSSKIKDQDGEAHLQADLVDYQGRAMNVLRGVQSIAGGNGDLTLIADEMLQDVRTFCSLARLRSWLPSKVTSEVEAGVAFLLKGRIGKSLFTTKRTLEWSALFIWIACHRLGEVVSRDDAAGISRTWIDEWQLARIIKQAFQDLGADEGNADRFTSLVRLLTSHQGWGQDIHSTQEKADTEKEAVRILQSWLQDGELQRFLGFIRYQDVLWFNKESFEEWLWWAFAAATIQLFSEGHRGAEDDLMTAFQNVYTIVQRLEGAAAESGYQVEKLLEGVHAEN